MRRPRLIAALGAGAVVVLCVAVVGVASAAARPGAHEQPAGEQIIPTDLQWIWLEKCRSAAGLASDGSMTTFLSTDADGRMLVEIGWMDDEGEITVDERSTAIVNDCVATRRVETDDGVYREATPAERLELYRWALDVQQPCLASRGIETGLPPLSAFLDEQTVPWYLLEQYVWSGEDGLVDDDFDVLLEARLACPPMPAYLAAQGVGW